MFEESLNEFGEVASHPTRVRGLKSRDAVVEWMKENVAPYTGAWIEIIYLGYPA